LSALTNLLGLKNFTGVDVACLKGGSGGGSAPVVESKAPIAEAKDDKKGGKDDKKGGKDDKKGGKEEKKKDPEPEHEEDFGGGMGDLFG